MISTLGKVVGDSQLILTCISVATCFSPFFLSQFSKSRKANKNMFILRFTCANECLCFIIFLCYMVSIFNGQHIFRSSHSLRHASQNQVLFKMLLCNVTIVPLFSKYLKAYFEGFIFMKFTEPLTLMKNGLLCG